MYQSKFEGETIFMSIEKFINNISTYNTGELALNPYSKQNEYCEIAKHNLSIYLNQFKMNVFKR